MTSFEERMQELFQLIKHPLVFMWTAQLMDPGAAHEKLTPLTDFKMKWQPFRSWGRDNNKNLIPAFRKFYLPNWGMQVGKLAVPIAFFRYTLILVETRTRMTTLFIWDSDTKTMFFAENFNMPLDEVIWSEAFTVFGIMRD